MTALSEAIGVTPSYISLLESGERQPSRDIVLRLGEVFFESHNIQALDELLVLAGLSPTRYELQLDPQDTLAVYEESLRQNPHDFGTYTAMLRLLVRTEKLTEAEDKTLDGMKLFTESYQLQVLMAYLQLCLKNFETAISTQLNALNFYQRSQKTLAKNDPIYRDLLINLGMMHFLWALDFLQREKTNPEESQQAKTDLCFEQMEQAKRYFEQATALTPQDIFLQDEYARICFNIAERSNGEARLQLWLETIDRLWAVICAEDVDHLGSDSIREINAYLAHAYSKIQEFDQARKLIGVLQSMHPDYWFVYYIKACHYALRYAHCAEDTDLDLAIVALQKSLKCQDIHNSSAKYALEDPDLAILRSKRKKAFAQVLDS